MTASIPVPAQIEAIMASHIGTYPDFPEPGVLFRDITPLLRDPAALRTVIEHWRGIIPADVEVIVGTEARGFVLGAPLAYEMGLGFVPVRKAGKLPGTPRSRTYDLEYGTATIEIADGALEPGVRALVVDDLLATGGTAAATVALAREFGADVVGATFLIELAALQGREKLQDVAVSTVWSIAD